MGLVAKKINRKRWESRAADPGDSAFKTFCCQRKVKRNEPLVRMVGFSDEGGCAILYFCRSCLLSMAEELPQYDWEHQLQAIRSRYEASPKAVARNVCDGD